MNSFLAGVAKNHGLYTLFAVFYLLPDVTYILTFHCLLCPLLIFLYCTPIISSWHIVFEVFKPDCSYGFGNSLFVMYNVGHCVMVNTEAWQQICTVIEEMSYYMLIEDNLFSHPHSSLSLGATASFFERLGLLNIQFPLIAILDVAIPILYIQFLHITYYIIFPSVLWSS
jgi:hypothetical protein